MSFRYGKRTFALELGMIFVALLFLFPTYVLICLSFKSAPEISGGGLGLPTSLETENYSKAWDSAHLGAALINSTLITGISLVTLIAVGSTASYYLARKQSRLSYGMYILFLLGIILPFQLALVPLYRMVSSAGLLGSYTSMVLFYTGLQAPFTIFLYTGFLRALPREYGEAALVDGATHWQSFRRITFPLLRPITGTVIILNAVFIWNDFLTPLIYLGGSPNETIPVVVYQFVGQYVSNWGYIFAAVVLATLPMLILFLLLQRFVIKRLRERAEGMSLRAVHLRCEHREDVPCVDAPAPRLGWALESTGRDKRQTAYRIRVGELWDSGRVESSNSVDVAYAGHPLPAAAECVWTVKVWDEAGAASDWSEPARFRTGLAGWSAQWIGRDRIHDPGMAAPDSDDDPDRLLRTLLGCPYLRRSFELAGGVRRATLYATARGVAELELNGTRVGDSVLAPGWTDYRKRIEYAAHDVTDLIRDGENVLGAILGPGWYAGFIGFDPLRRGNHYGRDPALLCELRLEHADGSVEVIASDAEWRATTGPIEYSDLLMGERCDARHELGPWAPVTTTPHDGVPLVPERSQPMRVTEELRPVAVTEREPGTYVFDLGQNMVGWVRLEVEGDRGTRVELRFAEMLERDGSLHVENLRTARALDSYTLRGGGRESFEPRFTFHGFRYVEVTGLSEAPAITGRVVHSDTPRSGWFECSDDMVNQLWRNINWGQRGNFVSVPTDCPQRDERLGWLADAQVFMPTATLNMDVSAFVTKWGDDVLDAQSPDGAYPDVAPRLALERDGAPAWADAGVIVPWIAWRRYGDLRLVERHWEAMERYLAYLERHNPDLLWTARRGNDYGDWLAVGEETPHDVLATAYWAYDAKLMAEMARALGRADRAEHYADLHARIAVAFNDAYVGDDALIEGDTQTVYLLALHMDLLPGDLRERAAERLVENLERHDFHLTTGFVGVGLLCPTLSETGYGDVAHRLLRNETFPSWGYSIRHGATTIWERWDGWTDTDGFQTPKMNSFNHYSLGSVGQWLYEYVGGIRAAAPGYERVLIAPEPGELEWARVEYRSVRGTISSAWRREGDELTLEVEIPPNVTATVVVPGGDTVEVGSGRHAFTAAVSPVG